MNDSVPPICQQDWVFDDVWTLEDEQLAQDQSMSPGMWRTSSSPVPATTTYGSLPAGMVPLADVTPTSHGSMSVSGSASQSAEGSATAAPPLSATALQFRRHSASELQQQPVGQMSGGRGSLGDTSKSTAGAASRTTERGRQRGGSASRAATKEKNKQAQQRWRDRQREKMQQSNALVATMQRRVQEMQCDQDALKHRCALLEHLMGLQQEATAATAGTPPSVPASGGDGGGGGGSAAAEAPTMTWWLTAHEQAALEDQAGMAGQHAFTALPDRPLFLTQAQVVELQPQKCGQLWQAYVVAAAQHLLVLETAGGDTAAAASRRLERLVFEMGLLKMAVVAAHPAEQLPALQRRRHDPAAAAPPPPTPEQWWQVITGARLSQDQAEGLAQLAAQHRGNVGTLAARRRAAIAELNVLPAAPDAGGSEAGGSDIADTATLRLLASIRDTLAEEHRALLQVNLAIWRSVLTPAQSAHICVATFPAHANLLAFAAAVAQDAGLAPAEDSPEPAAGPGAPLVALLPVLLRTAEPPIDLAALYPHLAQPTPQLPPAELLQAQAAATLEQAAPGLGDVMRIGSTESASVPGAAAAAALAAPGGGSPSPTSTPPAAAASPGAMATD